MKTKIFIDFDGTIFDTAGFHEEIFNVFRHLGFPEAEILSAYRAECLDYLFSMDDLAERLLEVRDFNLTVVKSRLVGLYSHVPKFIYKDVVSFLTDIDRRTHLVFLLSLGDINFQREKIRHAKLDQYFDHIYVTRQQKWEYLSSSGLVSPSETFMIVDDRADTIFKVKAKFKNAIALEIDRKGEDRIDPVRNVGRYKNEEITSMHQAEDILEERSSSSSSSS